MHFKRCEYIKIPVLPLRGIVVYPKTVVPLLVGRTMSIRCLKFAKKNNRQIMLVAQKHPEKNTPNVNDLFLTGTVSLIHQIMKLPDGTVKVLVEGLYRARLSKLIDNKKHLLAKIFRIPEKKIDKLHREAFIRAILCRFEKYTYINKNFSRDFFLSLKKIRDVSNLIDTVSAHLPLKFKHKQFILETVNLEKRLECILSLIRWEITLFNIENRIHFRVKKQIEKNQRKCYLLEQIKAIQKELNTTDAISEEHELLYKKIQSTKMPLEIRKKVELEFEKFKMMLPVSSESSVIRHYIDWLLSVPWYSKNSLKKDIKTARDILDKDHYGLRSIKERILEYLSVQNRTKHNKSPILCFVGPPGIGKTSLGKSIAKATNRKYVRMSLGGIRDEAEIRGHRRTYIGSMPGKIIQELSRIKVKNPLFLLDEVDKIASDTHGDPSSALLEVLDPEQNKYFNDHYLDVHCDLSEVMFISTANSMHIPYPLLDRMEVIRLSGYTEKEKFHIAREHLLKKQLLCHALNSKELVIKNETIFEIIRFYTREAGVRELERAIAKLCRKVVKIFSIETGRKSFIIDNTNLKQFLGIRQFEYGNAEKSNRIGRVTGLAWTRFGGDLLTIETVCLKGNGKLIYTGSLGKIMKESIITAFTVARSLSKNLGIDRKIYKKIDTHVHVPEGSVSKDGPSAGISICTALVSCLTKNRIKSNVAMTGEITLHGDILPVGGLKEKLLAASRSGVKTVVLPRKNKKNLEKIPREALENLNIVFVENIKKALTLVCERFPFVQNKTL